MRLSPLSPEKGYLPLEDHGLIGDGSTAALVARDGAVAWLCTPRFDSPPLFCGILDASRGGIFRVAPEIVLASGQRYEPDTGVLVTEMRSDEGLVQLVDALSLRSGSDLTEAVAAGPGELLRSVEVLGGKVRLRIEIAPFGETEVRPGREGLRLSCRSHPDLDLRLWSSSPLREGITLLDLRAGDRLHLVLTWADGTAGRLSSPDEALEATRAAWLRWATHLCYEGPHKALIRRSALTLKMLDYFGSGAIIAAPTSSLPEVIGGARNWDYRYAWIRDAAFSVYALHRIGLTREASRFVQWALDAAERSVHPRVLYDVDGHDPAPEREDAVLEGYRGSRPVRWGNAAADQRQHDVFGEILDCAFQGARHVGAVDAAQWARLTPLIEAAAQQWRTPDHGIWEVRSSTLPFTYSAALCQVALDRGVQLAERLGLPGPTSAWRGAADAIRRAVLEEAWNPELRAIAAQLGGGPLDASVLALPLRRVLAADHPRMIATTAAVQKHLGAGDGLLYRYLHDELPDGLEGQEGAFLLCSFWLVDNLAGQGRLTEATELYDHLCARANTLGLLPEQVDPQTGAFLGNYPQALSHVGLISSGMNLARRAGKGLHPT